MTTAAFESASASVATVRPLWDRCATVLYTLWALVRPLEAELHRCGIVMLPRPHVRAHMQSLLNEERPLWIGLLVSFCRLFVQTMLGAVLLVMPGIYGCVLLGGSLLFRDAYLALYALPLFLPLLLFFLCFGIIKTYEALGGTGAGARWEYFHLGRSGSAELPAHVLQRMRQVSGIRNVLFEEARFNKDPIIFACRERWLGLSYERVPIGAYSTGTSLDQM